MGFLSKLFGGKDNKSEASQFRIVVGSNQYDMPKDQVKTIQYTILLNYLNGKKKSKTNADFPKYFEYKYRMKNPIAFQKSLIDEGYLGPPSIEDCINSLKVPEIKELLKLKGESVTGKKAVLTERLIPLLTPVESEKIVNQTSILVATKKGKSWLSDNEWVVSLHKDSNMQISPTEYLNARKKMAFKASYDDVIWSILINRSSKYSNTPGLYRNNEYNKSILLKREGKIKQAIQTIVNVIYSDLSGFEGQYVSNPILIGQFIDFIRSNIGEYDSSMVDESITQMRNVIRFSLYDSSTIKKIIEDAIKDSFINDEAFLKKYKKKPIPKKLQLPSY